jgi:hypothetical protein
MPRVFAMAYRTKPIATSRGFERGGLEPLEHDEASALVEGCPECGQDVETVPMALSGAEGRPHFPAPYPISEWPEPLPAPGKRGNVYESHGNGF